MFRSLRALSFLKLSGKGPYRKRYVSSKVRRPTSGDSKFGRSCGNDPSLAAKALTGSLIPAETEGDGKSVTIATAISMVFMGMAFFAVSIILGVTGAGRNWWLWLLIHAFAVFGSGFAQSVRLKRRKTSIGITGQSSVAECFRECLRSQAVKLRGRRYPLQER